MQTSDVIAAFIEEYELLGYSPRTVARYRWTLGKLAGHGPELPTGRRDLLLTIASGGRSEYSRLAVWQDLRRFYSWTAKRLGVPDYMADVPAPRTRRHVPAILDADELVRVVRSTRSRRDRAVLALILDTGLRSGEIARMQWADVHPDGVEVDGKTGSHRVPLSPEVRRLMVGLGDPVHVWTGQRGPLTRWGIEKLVRRTLERAGARGRKRGPHILRHTFATTYIKAGGNVRVLQEILGHTDLKTTMVYVHLAGRDVATDHAAHSPITYLRLLETEVSTDDQQTYQ